MNLTFFYYLSGLLGAIVLAGFIYFLYDRFKEFQEPEDGREIENYMLQHTNGCAQGIIDKIVIGKNKIKIEAYYYNKRKLSLVKRYKPEFHRTYHDIRQVVPLFFGNEDIIKAFPPRSDMLPLGFLNTDFGKKIAELIEKNNEIKDGEDILRERLRNLDKISKETTGARVMVDYMKTIQRQMKDLGESQKKDETKKP